MEFKNTILLICFFCLFLFTACGGGGGESSSAVPDPDPETAATFTDVNQIISANCLSCHGTTPSNGAPMALATFSQVSFFASSIADRINLSEGSNLLMPLNGPKLSTSEIEAIESWIAAGKLNN